MDRTQIDNRGEEKNLCELIYSKLGMLTKLQVPTPEFKSIYSKDMFIRPNFKAFVHVIHFLFTLYDISEFKKRFLWPIFDKQSESKFRSSALEYLEYLKAKHNCEWRNLNRSLLVMPGGYKFLLFLNDFLEFVAKELLKQREKYLPKNVNLKDLNIRSEIIALEKKTKTLYINSAAYAELLDGHTYKYKKSIKTLYNILVEISRKTRIPMKDLLKPLFVSNFEEYTFEELKNKIINKTENICNSEKLMDSINESITLYQSEKVPLEYDKRILLLNDDDLVEENLVKCNDSNLANLVDVYTKLIPEIIKTLSMSKHYSVEAMEFQNDELKKLYDNVSETNMEITEISNIVKTGVENHLKTKETPNHQKLSSDLRAKYIETPPISQNYSKSGITRLPLMEDNYDTNNSTRMDSCTLNNTVLKKPLSAKKAEEDVNTDFKQSNTFNAPEFLRGVTGSTKKKKHLTPNDKKHCNYNVSITGYNTRLKKIRRSIISPLRDCDNKKKIFPDNLINTSPAFQKIQNSARPIEKLSTSPTGRLDPLVYTGHVPQIFVDEVGILEETLRKIDEEPTYIVDEILNEHEDNTKINQNIENTPISVTNIKNEGVKLDFELAERCERLNVNESDADNIFNISDTVLNDVAM